MKLNKRKIYLQKYYIKNRQIILSRNSLESTKIRKHEWYLKNIKRISIKRRLKYKKFRKIILVEMKKYRDNNKSIIKKRKHLEYIKHQDTYKNRAKIRYVKCKARIMKWAKEYQRIRRNSDIKFRITDSLRSRLNVILKGKSKSARTLKLLGCSISHLKKHLESKFTFGMSWNNYGRGWGTKGMQEWHIDHIKPCASFDLSKPSEQRKCFHYTNLQPMWAKNNLIKGGK